MMIFFMPKWIGSIVQTVAHLVRNDAPNAPGGVGRIAVPSRDEMDMGMKDRLAGRAATVHPDVEAGDARVGVLELLFEKSQ